MRSTGVGLTDVGRKRDHNEDAFFTSDDDGLYIVADGMGGAAAGEIASACTVSAVRRVIAEGAADAASRDDRVLLVQKAIETACREVYELAQTDRSKRGMGCTCTLAWVRNGFAVIGHVGDSRCYLWRDRVASQVTMDHTVAAELVASGAMSPDEIDDSPYSHMLSRAVGTKPFVQVDAFAIPLTAGDRLLLCSDGLANYIPEAKWLGSHLQGDAPEGTVEELVSHANDSGGSDNISVVLVTLEATADEEDKQRRRHATLSGGLSALGKVFLFKNLSMGLRSRLLTHCNVRRCESGEVVLEEGEQTRRLLVVMDGRFEVRRGDNILGSLMAGDHTAVTTLLKPRPARASLVAGQPSTLLELERDSFWALIKKRPWLGVNLMEVLVGKLSSELDASVVRRDDRDDTTTPLASHQLL